MAGGEQFDKAHAGGTIETTEIVDGVALAAVLVSEGDDGEREDDSRVPVFGALGVGGRPLDSDSDGAAEPICARLSDGLAVMCARDLRIERGRGSEPAKGTIYFAGYHGAEVRFDVASSSRSTVTVTDNNGRDLVLDDQGVRAPSSPLIQGDPNTAADVLLAQPAIDLHKITGQIVLLLAAAVNGLAPGSITPTQISDLTTALAPFLVPGSPSAPTTRAPDLRGEPGT